MTSPYHALRALLSDRPIAFHPMMARALGGINEALLFQQLAYWSDKGSDPEWIYKTQVELEAETTLSEYQQVQARKRLKALGVIEDQRRGVPARLYYRVNWSAVYELLEAFSETESRFPETQNLDASDSSSRETRNLDSKQPAGKIPGNSAPISEITTKTTQRENSNSPHPRFVVDPADQEVIERYARDFALEFRDEADLSSTLTRMLTMYWRSGLDLDAFLGELQTSRSITQKQSAGIRKQAPDGSGMKAKMPYFLEVLADRLGQRGA